VITLGDNSPGRSKYLKMAQNGCDLLIALPTSALLELLLLSGVRSPDCDATARHMAAPAAIYYDRVFGEVWKRIKKRRGLGECILYRRLVYFFKKKPKNKHKLMRSRAVGIDKR